MKLRLKAVYIKTFHESYLQGNVEIYHKGMWGGICDDEWDKDEAKVACRSLGYPGAEMATNGARYGYSPAIIWMDNMYCYGTEKRLDVRVTFLFFCIW